jgi:lambda repressor-like predicted transcriptional regulator
MPLSPVEIKVEILKRGDTLAGLAKRWGTSRSKLSRVVNRSGQFVYPHIRRKLARYLKVSISEVGREPQKIVPKQAKKAA